MKKILAYVSPEKHASLFDAIVAYDAGADVVVPYTDITAQDMKNIILCCVFTRHPDDLKNTAVFIGGHDVGKAKELMDAVVAAFRELPDSFRVSVAVDPDGAYTTASACVVKTKKLFRGDLSGLNAAILAGTGPVGQIVSVLFAREGCNVVLTSRKLGRAENACRIIKKNYGVEAQAFEVKSDETAEKAVSDSDIVVATGPEGVRILPKEIWLKSQVKVMVDVTAVPPYGIEGVDVRDDGRELDGGKLGVGALAVGGLKMKCHHELVKGLFREKGTIFNLERVYGIAQSI